MAQEEQFNENPVSTRQGIIKKYDVNGDGMFDANEINCIMDDYMFLTQTNKSLVDTNYNQKKLLSGTFLLIVLLSMSNLGTAFLAANMSKEVVVVDGKIVANGGSQEEAISTMTSVRTLTKQFNGDSRILQNNGVFSETSPTDEGDNGKVVCFTADEVQSLFDNAMNGSGTNIVLEGTSEDGSSSTTVIPINGGGSIDGGVYTFSNVQFVQVDIDSCDGPTRRSLEMNRDLGFGGKSPGPADGGRLLASGYWARNRRDPVEPSVATPVAEVIFTIANGNNNPAPKPPPTTPSPVRAPSPAPVRAPSLAPA